jgi:GNAT superfamily N-acetyltransferase
MKDIPMFTTLYGIASLSLGEIPYRQTAYIRVRSVADDALEDLISECAQFCRAAGAERIFWTAENMEREPQCVIYEMRGTAWVDRAKLESLFPVTDATVKRWREVYNERMAEVDHVATLSAFDEKRIVQSGGAYFVHHEGSLLGIGWLEDTKLLAIAAAEKGTGDRVAHTLMSMVEGATMTLEVASTNERAIRLYERLGFLRTSEVTRWYRVI